MKDIVEHRILLSLWSLSGFCVFFRADSALRVLLRWVRISPLTANKPPQTHSPYMENVPNWLQTDPLIHLYTLETNKLGDTLRKSLIWEGTPHCKIKWVFALHFWCLSFEKVAKTALSPALPLSRSCQTLKVINPSLIITAVFLTTTTTTKNKK